MKRKRSWTCEEMRDAIFSSDTIADVLRKLNLTIRPGNYRTVNKFAKEFSLDMSFMSGKSCGKGGIKKKELNEILIKNSPYGRSGLKARLLKEGLIENKCQIPDCPNPNPEWKGQKLVLIIDHINGINDDNRLENLRMVCPNCASQLPTHCRK